MKAFIGIILLLPLLIFGTVRVVNGILFDKDCEGYLKRAADANSVDQAKEQLKVALNYMEGHGLTKGFTSVLYNTPDEDLGFWYKNIKSAKIELDKVTDETTSLEKSNVLMKLRETLLDEGEEGSSVTVPTGISIYPNNIVYFWLGLLSFVIFCGGCVLLFIAFDEY
jgi:hypothetical protein